MVIYQTRGQAFRTKETLKENIRRPKWRRWEVPVYLCC